MHLDHSTTGVNNQIEARDLMCPICMTIAEDPHISSCCHRIFCAKDANSNRYDNGCPLCREINYTFQPSALHKTLLDQLTTKCACSERILPEDYESHQERCSNVKFPCPHLACQDKQSTSKYNSQELVNHLARAHCDEVPVLGSTYINKKSLEPYKKRASKYEDLVSTLFSDLYPKMIDGQLKANPVLQSTSPVFQCQHGHQLINADRTQRKRKDGSVYSTPGFNCDKCHRTFPNGQSWHCSCSDSGFDKCVSCLVFELFEIKNDNLQLASQDYEDQQQRYRRQTIRNTVRLPRGLFRLLSGSIDDDDDETGSLHLHHRPSFLSQQNTYEGTDDDEIEVNLRED